MVNVAERTLNEVDVILWLVEPSTFIGAGERHIVDQLKKTKTPVILIINKIDKVDKKEIIKYMDAYRKVYDFAEIIPVSALRSVNMDTVIESIFKYLPYGPQFYDEDTVTDQPQRQIVAEMIRETVSILTLRSADTGMISAKEATIICERDSHKGIIIGKGGQMLRRIGSQARRDIEDMLEEKVNLQLWVKVKKDWRDSDFMIKNFGYDKKDI